MMLLIFNSNFYPLFKIMHFMQLAYHNRLLGSAEVFAVHKADGL